MWPRPGALSVFWTSYTTGCRALRGRDVDGSRPAYVSSRAWRTTSFSTMSSAIARSEADCCTTARVNSESARGVVGSTSWGRPSRSRDLGDEGSRSRIFGFPLALGGQAWTRQVRLRWRKTGVRCRSTAALGMSVHRSPGAVPDHAVPGWRPSRSVGDLEAVWTTSGSHDRGRKRADELRTRLPRSGMRAAG